MARSGLVRGHFSAMVETRRRERGKPLFSMKIIRAFIPKKVHTLFGKREQGEAGENCALPRGLVGVRCRLGDLGRVGNPGQEGKMESGHGHCAARAGCAPNAPAPLWVLPGLRKERTGVTHLRSPRPSRSLAGNLPAAG